MKAVYVDNFRGFKGAIIPFERVNFLVGENSTGKSSVLSLLYHVCDPRSFWFSTDFNDDEVEMGNFEDLVSCDSDDKTSFSIGFVTNETKGKSSKTPEHPDNSVVVVTYFNNNGSPRSSRLTYTSSDMVVTCKISKSRIYFKSVSKSFGSEISLDDFNEVIKIHNGDSTGYTKVKTPENFYSNFHEQPLFIIKELVDRSLTKQISSSELSFKFSVPSTGRVVWIAPIREKPKRTYDNLKTGFSTEGAHTPHLINEILNGKNQKVSNELSSTLKQFGKESGLFGEIQAKRYGKSNSSPFEIDVVLKKEPLKITSVGYGVAQVLPIIVESFIRQKKTTFAIQQPEVHLHPKAQAALGDFFHRLSKDEDKGFVLETHSDFLIDRFRQSVNKSKHYTPSQVLFFCRGKNGNECHPIKIEADGSYSDNQPKAFKEFFIKEQLALLEI